MSYLLHINTALDKAFVGISGGDRMILFRENLNQKEHGAFLQPAIRDISSDSGIRLSALAAVSVIYGPGSYTGLRVGLAAAKGICYPLGKPLICISTLEWMASPFYREDPCLICPMIDARRMEVFTATYDNMLRPVREPRALILDEGAFPELETGKIIFTGNGRNKLPASIASHPNALLPDTEPGINEQANMANLLYQQGSFADLAYAEPFYLKPFHTLAK